MFLELQLDYEEGRRNSSVQFAIPYRAQIRYKLNGRWELGDFLPASIRQYRSYLKRAKRATQSWNDKETGRMLDEMESVAGQIFQRTNAEQWAVNVGVHYNNWANLTPSDFSTSC